MNTVRIMHSRHRTDVAEVIERMNDSMSDPAEIKGGDVRVAWDSDSEEETRAVGQMFDELVKDKGYTAVKIGDEGKISNGTTLKKFDKNAQRMVLVPPLQGGESY